MITVIVSFILSKMCSSIPGLEDKEHVDVSLTDHINRLYGMEGYHRPPPPNQELILQEFHFQTSYQVTA